MKRALVTGGSGEIGRAISKQLAADGYHVYIHANTNLKNARLLADELKKQNFSVTPVAFDVSNAESTNEALEKILSDGPIQILINNAGIHEDVVMPGMKAEQWSRVIDVSL